jgi:fatty acid desaturase
MATTAESLYPARPGNISPLLHRIAVPLFAVLMVFSALGAAIVLSLSMALHVGRRLLECIPGVSAGASAIAAAYHRQIQKLANRVLKDPRDEPILAAAITLGWTAYPVLALQLYIGEPSILLALLFYACVFGPKIRGYTRSFSAMHQEGHRVGGMFKRPSVLEKWTGNSFLYMYFALPMGLTPHAAAHLQQHHRENAGPLDVYATARYDHASLRDFMVYMVKEVMYQQFMISPYLYFREKRKPAQMRSMIFGNVLHIGLFALLAWYSLPIAVMYMLIPWMASNVLMGVIHWSQHAFYGEQGDPKDFMANTITLLETPVNMLNEGYHVCHHHWENVHWSESPALYERIKPQMKAAGSIVFRDYGVLDLFVNLMLHRFDAMAKKLEWWEPISHEEKVALLKRRAAAAPIAEHERQFRRRLAGAAAGTAAAPAASTSAPSDFARSTATEGCGPT